MIRFLIILSLLTPITGLAQGEDKPSGNSISPKVSTYYTELGNLAEQQGRLRNAIDYYRSAIAYGASAETHFFLARASDQYFKDKSIALHHYQDYRGSGHREFLAYTEQRIGQLKEIIHFQQ